MYVIEFKTSDVTFTIPWKTKRTMKTGGERDKPILPKCQNIIRSLETFTRWRNCFDRLWNPLVTLVQHFTLVNILQSSECVATCNVVYTFLQEWDKALYSLTCVSSLRKKKTLKKILSNLHLVDYWLTIYTNTNASPHKQKLRNWFQNLKWI